ncbi:MAG: class I SAM-dependent methyltransferase [Flavobacteriaceae bacterium]|nr:class I SAM-dependent methyltransferase [Flavobacteriaceae bacterium]
MKNKIKSLYRFLSPKFQNVFFDYEVEPKPRYGHGLPPHKQLLDIISANDSVYESILLEALQHKDVFCQIKNVPDGLNPHYNNDFLPGLDMVGIYTMLAKYKPEKYVEVGSGNSTKVAHHAVKTCGLSTEIISMDPYPRAEIDQLANKIVRQPFEKSDFDFLFQLKENDILFIDNSHRILPNSDAMVFFMEVMPRLAKGVIVHIHDIYLPYDYPQFMCDRFYSEQYGLAFYLLANPAKYQTIFPCYYISEHKKLSQILNPVWEQPNLAGVERHGGSYWLNIGE